MQFPEGSARALTLTSAHPIVIAAVSARLHDSAADVVTVLSQFHSEAQERGLKDSSSWALLFSAAVVLLAEEICNHAKDTDLDERDLLRRLALDVASKEL